MALRVGELVAVLRVDASDWDSGLREAERGLTRLQREVDESLQVVHNRVNSIATSLGRLGQASDGIDDLNAGFRRTATAASRTATRVSELIDPAQQAGRALSLLRFRAEAAANALSNLAQQARQVRTALRGLNTQLDSATTNMTTLGDNASVLGGRFSDANSHAMRLRDTLREIRGTTGGLNTSLNSVNNSSNNSSSSLGALTGSLGSASSAMAPAAAGGMALSTELIALAAVVGTSALPAVSAFVPMVMGLGLAVGAGAMAFNGMGDALKEAGGDQKKYAEALKKLTPVQRDTVKELAHWKAEFKDISKEVQKAALPKVTQMFKDMRPLILPIGESLARMGKGLGTIAEDFGNLAKESPFGDDFVRTLDMGVQSITKMGRAMVPLTRSLFDFGAASKPALDAFTNGISGLLSKGIPGLFAGLKTGIGGAAKLFSGLFDMINQLLPAIGRFSGTLANTLGPFFGSLFRVVGQLVSAFLDGLKPALDALAPVFTGLGESMERFSGPLATVIGWLGQLAGVILRVAVAGLVSLFDAARICAPIFATLASTIGGLLAPAFSKMNGSMSWIDRVRDFAKTYAPEIQYGAAQLASGVMSAFIGIAEAAPMAYDAFHSIASIAMATAGVVINSMAKAFGWVPGIGPKLKAAAASFNSFQKDASSKLDAVGRSVHNLSEGALAKMKPAQLRMNIKNFETSLATAKKQLADPEISKERKVELKALIKDLENGVRVSKERLAELTGKDVDIRAKDKTAKGKAEAMQNMSLLPSITRGLYAKDGTKPGKNKAQGTMNTLLNVTRGFTSRDGTRPGKNKAQGTMNSLSNVVRGFTATDGTRPGRSRAQGTMNGLRGVSRDLTANNRVSGAVSAAQRIINGLRGRAVTLTANFVAKGVTKLMKAFGLAQGGEVRGYAGGGLQGYPNGGKIRGHGTPTSDSNLIWASRGEYMVRAAAVRKYGVPFFEALNNMKMPAGGTGGPSPAITGPTSTSNSVTYNVYPRTLDMKVRDLDLLQRQQEAYSRVGRQG